MRIAVAIDFGFVFRSDDHDSRGDVSRTARITRRVVARIGPRQRQPAHYHRHSGVRIGPRKRRIVLRRQRITAHTVVAHRRHHIRRPVIHLRLRRNHQLQRPRRHLTVTATNRTRQHIVARITAPQHRARHFIGLAAARILIAIHTRARARRHRIPGIHRRRQ